MKDKRIMIFTASIGSGHDQVAKVLVEGLSQLEGVTAAAFDYMELWGPPFRELFKQGYFKMLDWVPSWYHLLYQNTMRIAEGNQVKHLLGYRYEKKMLAQIQEFCPDIILCTNPFPLVSLSHLRKRGKVLAEIAVLITDYTAHSMWLDDAVSYYFVGSHTLKSNLMDRGIPQEQIYMTGIPIDPKFYQPVNPLAIYQREQLDPSLKTILVMGGGLGLGPFEEILSQLERVPEPMQLLVVTGKNEKLRGWLEKERNHSHHKINVYGYIDYVHELMTIAHLLISKAGGITLTEAMAKCLPIFITAPIPGQEVGNTEFIEQIGIGKHIRQLDTLGQEVQRVFFESQWEYEAMKANIQWLKRPNALEEIMERLVKPYINERREGSPTIW